MRANCFSTDPIDRALARHRLDARRQAIVDEMRRFDPDLPELRHPYAPKPPVLAGRLLRYAALIVLDDCRTDLPIAAVRGRIEAMGYRIQEPQASKRLADALAHETVRGRVERRQRGHYRIVRLPRATRYRATDRLLAERLRASREAKAMSPGAEEDPFEHLPPPPNRHEGVHHAIALLTVLLDESDGEPDEHVVQAVAPDLASSEQAAILLKGMSELSAWLLMHLEELSEESTTTWLQRAALDFCLLYTSDAADE